MARKRATGTTAVAIPHGMLSLLSGQGGERLLPVPCDPRQLPPRWLVICWPLRSSHAGVRRLGPPVGVCWQRDPDVA
jgi:hypothetical protein